MHFRTRLMTLATSLSVATAYLITGDNVNCRKGPSTAFEAARTYPLSTDVNLTCQTRGQDIFGNTLWDKTTDGCYVSDYYVDTGPSDVPVAEECDPPGGGPDGTSPYQGEINRTEIISRGRYWVDQHVPYSMSRNYPDPQGRNYRTDCSGFVSMALHASAPGYNTVSLPSVSEPIEWSQLKPGDYVGTLGEGTGGADGHVTLFLSWADDARTSYNTLECKGDVGCVQFERPVGWMVGNYTAEPFRYTKVVDC
ncbi:hypothetical protein QBC42DRAFT_207960 [Cladorrhinum samala]|uniref:NlpC/P60 domain-containing protein n=1 Tax=Cladorrhinum samala TaxID=585594 RepID=A0AAV9HIH0_9PEZI|nr:hypothetical protein QBC42DRAFT_207960 [Cladorrhinum samala]